MKSRREISGTIGVTLLGMAGMLPLPAYAQNTISFSTSDTGVTKAVAEWGVDTAWPSADNIRLSIANMGANNVDVVRVTFHPGQALIDNGNGTFSLNSTAKGYIDTQLSLSAGASAKPLTFVPGEFGSTYDATNWIRTIKATQEYINSKPGYTTTQIKAIETFNEPDYWVGEGNAAQLNSAIAQLKTYSVFQNTTFPAASTLNSNNAQGWYNQVPEATAGSSHLLGGSLTSYVNFMDNVKNGGKPFVNPELHSLGEAIVGADHGMTSGTWWADVLRARGLFVQASDGKRLGYYQDLPRQSAAAVYRGTDGKIRAYAGGLERFGSATAYRFVSSDKDVFFNGIGPMRQFMLQTKYDENASSTDNDFQNYGSWSNQGAYADVEFGGNIQPALDGYRWKILNADGTSFLEVAGSGTSDGALIRTAASTNTLNQKWDIVRTRNGYLELFNTNSGRTAEVANGSLNSGASIRQWGTADNIIQQWTIDDAGNGYFFIRNANSGKYLTSNSTNAMQTDATGTNAQKWRFVLANPTTPNKARYHFENNSSDDTGTYHAVVTGSPSYVTGPNTAEAQAISLNGTNAYLTLPSGVASSKDITVSTWVNWNGGNNWQRIFDFGNDTTSYMFLTPKSGSNTMRFALTRSGNSGEEFLDTDSLPTGQWTHLAVTIGGNTAVLYVNGKPRVAGNMIKNPGDFNPSLNYIGKSQFSGDPLFNGAIDDFRIFDYALDAAAISDLVPLSIYTWTGASTSNVWSNSITNWKRTFDSVDSTYSDNNSVQFDDSAAKTIVALNTNVSPTSVLFNNSGVSYSLIGSAGITGTASLTKNGYGTLGISNVNSYTGTTTVNAGTLNLSGTISSSPILITGGTLSELPAGIISGNVPLTVMGVATLGGNNTLGAFRVSGTGSVNVFSGTTTTDSVTGQLTIADSTGDNAILSTNVTGILNVNKATAPGVVVGAANAATGTLSINLGVMNIVNELWIGTVSGSNGILAMGGGTLNVGGAGVKVAVEPGSKGTIDFGTSAGTLSTAAITGGAGSSTLNISGGILQAAASGNFLSGIDVINIRKLATFNTNGFNIQISQPLTHSSIAGDAAIDGGLLKTGAGTMTLNSPSTYTGPTSVNGGKLITQFGIQNGHQLNISNGATLEVSANGSASGVTSINTFGLGVGNTSSLQLHDNDLIINYASTVSPYAATVTKVKAGLTLLGGTGVSGIKSSEVDAQTLPGTVLAVVDDGHPSVAGGITSLSGFVIPNPATSVLVKYTWFGDANLDGIVDGSDYALIDTGFTSGGALTGWVFGDFDYNGSVQNSDYGLIDTGFIAQTGALPEPGMLGLFGLALIKTLSRKRQRN